MSNSESILIFKLRIYLDYNKIGGKGLSEIAEGMKTNVMIRYLALWGNEWDENSCEVFKS
jgi:hypothetical protein